MDHGCLSANRSNIRVWRGEDADLLNRGGRRVPGDDLLLATADVPAANDLAFESQREQRAGLALLLPGALLFAPGVGLIGFGLDHNQRAATTAGGVVTAAGVVSLVAGAALFLSADRKRDRAIATYNAEAPASCPAVPPQSDSP